MKLLFSSLLFLLQRTHLSLRDTYTPLRCAQYSKELLQSRSAVQLAKSCRARRAPKKERVRRDEEEGGKKQKAQEKREEQGTRGPTVAASPSSTCDSLCVPARSSRRSHTKTMTVGPRAALTTSLAYRLSLSSCSRSYSSPQGSHKLAVFLLLSCFLFASFLPRALLSSSSSSDSHFSSALFEV